MGSVRNNKVNVFFLIILVIIQSSNVECYQFKVGDLHAWGIPTSANPKIYTDWAKNNIFKLGDSLLFLYPPSQDSLIQVSEESFNSCNLEDPILFMNNGNSVFNFTQAGDFYFTSGVKGHCEKHQKLHVSIAGNGSTSSPSSDPNATAPSYSNVFGSIPMAPSASLSSSSSILEVPFFVFTAVMVILISLQI